MATETKTADRPAATATTVEVAEEERRTSSEIPIRRFYTPRDVAGIPYPEKLGDPGQYPYTRGLYPDMYRKRHWTMRQYAGYSSAAESNKRYRYLLSQGTTGLSVAFDLPTQIGYDSDSPLARGEVGRVGVAIDSIADMRLLFDAIPLDRVTTSMTINATAAILLSLYLVVAEEQGVSWEKVGGTVQNDILKEYAARGTYIYPPKPSLKLVTDIIAFCAERVPKWNTISISGYHMREAGSTAVQEVAFTLANGLAYVQAALDRGLSVDEFAPRLSFFFNAHNNFLEEVSKFRAARRLWAELVRERFGAKDPRSLWLRFHTQTAGSTLTAQQPQNNVVRVAIQALAAVCGGTQSLHTNSLDEALGLPTEEAARLALRTQQVIANESGVADVADPLGGSYVVEAWTEEIVQRSRDYIRRIDEMGGALAGLERGFQQKEIADAAYIYQMAVEEKREIVVGVNAYASEAGLPTEVLRIDPEAEREQVERLRAVRERRDLERAAAAVRDLTAAAREDRNLMPAILDSVRAEVTLGEISDALREVYGEYREAGLE
ncbi:MAG TPA: methylmalonyl-CoA mutase family protein [Thermoanaerobaculia bacterium]|jgi:methylmalonyl-CoA mutase N-terminal domain/subunit|nr:methylmalonyl-CoA mutase family protein [Thermoanaerobaculia bacterium]